MRKLLALLLAAVLAAGLAAGCGSSGSARSSASTQSTASVQLAKTKFALHAGLAFGAFHRYIYKPFKAGQLSGGVFHNPAAKLKALVAASFAYHEVRLALDDARASPTLSRVLAPLLALQDRLKTLHAGLHAGDISQVAPANSALNSVGGLAGAAGQPISDQPTPTLGG